MMSEQNTTPETVPDPTPHARSSAIGHSRRNWFRLFAVLAGLLPLVALEGGLRLFDVGRPADAPDPFVGFNRNFPLFERQGGVYRTSRSRAPFIASQEFPAEKPPGSFRMFCFGGSTVYGHPYTGETSFPKWLELELAGRDPSRAWQAINCGGVSYASYRIAPMVQEILRYQPDLIIVATGHNEFLEDRTYHSLKTRSALWSWVQRTAYSLHTVNLVRQSLHRDSSVARSSVEGAELSPHVNTRLDYASGYASYRRDEGWWQNVAAQYDDSVRQIVAACRAAHVPVLLIRLGSNLRDCPPYKSEHRTGLDAGAEADWQAAFDLATAAEKTDLPRALRLYQEADAIDADYALLNFRIARVLDRLGARAGGAALFPKSQGHRHLPAPHHRAARADPPADRRRDKHASNRRRANHRRAQPRWHSRQRLVCRPCASYHRRAPTDRPRDRRPIPLTRMAHVRRRLARSAARENLRKPPRHTRPRVFGRRQAPPRVARRLGEAPAPGSRDDSQRCQRFRPPRFPAPRRRRQ